MSGNTPHAANTSTTENNIILENLKTNLNLNLTASDGEKELTIRAWKNGLLDKSTDDVLQLVQYIRNDKSDYMKKTLLPLLNDSMQVKNITYLLSIIQAEYSSALNADKAVMFTEKKAAIKKKLADMYRRGLLDNKLIFGLGIYITQNDKVEPFQAGTFWEDVKKWLFTGDSTEAFWGIVTGKVQAETSDKLVDALTQ